MTTIYRHIEIDELFSSHAEPGQNTHRDIDYKTILWFNYDLMKLTSLLKKDVIQQDLVRQIADPREAIRHVLAGIRTGFAGRVKKAIMTKVDDYRYGIDSDRLQVQLRSMLDMDEPTRRGEMRKLFQEALDTDHEIFYRLVQTLGEIDIFNLTVESKTADSLSGDDLLLPLELDYELYTELIQTAKAHPSFKAWMAFLSEKTEGKKPMQQGQQELKLNGAALPEIFPKIDHYVESAMKYLGGRSCDKGKKFMLMLEAFKKISEEVFGKDMEAFCAVATTRNLTSLVSRFWSAFPHAELIAEPYEYLPMWYAVSDATKRHMIDIDNLNFNEEHLTVELLRKGETIRQKRKAESVPEKDPIVLLISTQMRIGAKLLDPKKIMQWVDAENEFLGFQQYHVWFDASQDSRIVADGDLVFYSKRFAGSGGGMVLANKATYPEDDGHDIRESFRLRSSYDVSIIPRLTASLHLTSRKVGHHVANLAQTPGLWYFQGKGTFVAGEVEKARSSLSQSPIVKDLFTLEHQMPSDAKQWKVDAVMRIIPTDKALKMLDMKKLSQDLHQRFSVDFSCFNLQEHEGGGGMSFSELTEACDAEPFNRESFIAKVEAFQFYYQSWIVKSLLPSEGREDADVVRAYFRQAVKEHSYFRIFTTALDKPDTLREFIKRLEQAVKLQLEPLGRLPA